MKLKFHIFNGFGEAGLLPSRRIEGMALVFLELELVETSFSDIKKLPKCVLAEFVSPFGIGSNQYRESRITHTQLRASNNAIFTN